MTNLTAQYEQLLELNDRAFRDGRYKSAYHALMATLHCAKELSEERRLTEIEERAAQQLAWIDAHALDPQVSALYGVGVVAAVVAKLQAGLCDSPEQRCAHRRASRK
jgi:ADP-ribose pyrophosphatase YjhB (NUDIX family)